MANLSNYLEAKLADAVLRGIPYVSPTSVQIALYRAAPSDAGGGTELSGLGYARVTVACSTTAWNAASTTDGRRDNAQAINFPTATAAWPTVTHVGLFDQAGNFLMWGPLAVSITTNANQVFSFAPGVLAVIFG